VPRRCLRVPVRKLLKTETDGRVIKGEGPARQNSNKWIERRGGATTTNRRPFHKGGTVPKTKLLDAVTKTEGEDMWGRRGMRCTTSDIFTPAKKKVRFGNTAAGLRKEKKENG